MPRLGNKSYISFHQRAADNINAFISLYTSKQIKLRLSRSESGHKKPGDMEYAQHPDLVGKKVLVTGKTFACCIAAAHPHVPRTDECTERLLRYGR